METKNLQRIFKYIRVGLSLAVIGLGLYTKNWLGVIGLVTLMSALTGTCPLTVNISRRSSQQSEK